MVMEYHLLAFSLYTLILIYLKQMSQKMFHYILVETEICRKCKKIFSTEQRLRSARQI